MTTLMRRLANFQDKQSVSYQLRNYRMQFLEELVDRYFPSQREIKIIDVGGTQKFWETFPVRFLKRSRILLLNLTEESTSSPIFQSIAGDATAMPQFHDKEFDLVFSNSVIEHVGSYGKQQQMADEIRRIGKNYFVQTPNRYFPVEPHFLFPFFQFFPRFFQIELIRHFNIGQFSRMAKREDAITLVRSIQLLSKNEMIHLFPESTIYTEKIIGINKSFIAYYFQ